MAARRTLVRCAPLSRPPRQRPRGRSIFAWGFELGTGGRARPRRQQRRANTRRGARSDRVSRRVYMSMSMYMYVCMCRCIALYVCDVCDLAVQLCCVRVLRRRQRTVLLVASDRFLNLVSRAAI